MSQIRWTLPGIAVALLLGYVGSNLPPAHGEPDSLEGTWEVTSVERSGEADPLQVGAQLIFTDNEVKFQPNVAQVADGAS